MFVKQAFGKSEGGVFADIDVVIYHRHALLMYLFAEEEKGSCGERAASRSLGTGSNVVIVDKEPSDEGPNRGLVLAFYSSQSVLYTMNKTWPHYLALAEDADKSVIDG